MTTQDMGKDIKQIQESVQPSLPGEILKYVNFSDNISPLELTLLLFVAIYTLKTFIPLIYIPNKIAATFTYITKEELLNKQEITLIMHEIMSASLSQRVLVGIFHNGTATALEHKKRLTVEFEVTDGLESIADEIKNLAVEKIADELLLCQSREYTSFSITGANSNCINHLNTINAVRKDFKYLSDINGKYGIINIHYLIEPDEHFMMSEARSKQMTRLTKRLEMALFKIMHPDKNRFQRFIEGFLVSFKD